MVALWSQSQYGQSSVFSNSGVLTVDSGAVLSTELAFDNLAQGNVTNKGEIIFYGDYTNREVFNSEQAGSKVTFSSPSSQPQKLSTLGTTTTSMHAVDYRSAGNISLSGSFQHTGPVGFHQGVIHLANTPDTEFVMGEKSSVTKVSDQSYVSGKVTKHGKTDFTYPVGDMGYYRPVSTLNLNGLANYGASYHKKNADTQYPFASKSDRITLINDQEYWTLEKSDSSDYSLVELSWREGITPEKLYENEGRALTIVRWDSAAGVWLEEGAVVDYASQSVKTFSKIKQTGVFTLAMKEDTNNSDDDTTEGGGIYIYNGVSPNGDGINDYLKIEGLERYPDNSLTVVNRWGRELYKTTGYGQEGNVFSGESNVSGVFQAGSKLPSGTYFYILEYKVGEKIIKKVGYIHLETN